MALNQVPQEAWWLGFTQPKDRFCPPRVPSLERMQQADSHGQEWTRLVRAGGDTTKEMASALNEEPKGTE